MATYKELYDKQMRIEKVQDPEVVFLADTTREDVNWLQSMRKASKEDK